MNFDDKQHSLVTFRVGSILCCAPCLYVKSIITPPAKFTKPPGTNKTSPGIFKHGAHIVKVIDLRQKFCVAEESEKGNLIIVIFNDESFAFWVDQIIDVFDFPSKGWSGLPAGIPKDAFIRTLVLNEKIHLYTEFEKLITIGELSYFKNHSQKKETTKEDPIIKQKVKKAINENPNKTTPSPSIEKKPVPTTNLAKAELKTNTVISNTKKTPHQEIKVTEKNTRQPNLLTKRKNNEEKINKVLINPTAPVKTTKEQQKTDDNKTLKPTIENITLTEEESSAHIFKIIFVLLIFLAAVALYFLYPSGSDLTITQKNKIVELEVIEDTAIDDETLENAIEITYPPMLPATTESKTEETVSNNIIPQVTETKKDTVEKINPHPEGIKKEIADKISPHLEEIKKETTEKMSPNPEEIKKEAVDKITPHSEEIKKETTEKMSPNPEEIKKEEKKVVIKVYTPQAVKKKIKPLIIHTVIKGDTLWAITKKYINNPFRYPELAALNKIKNPHRIYPGDQVQIRFIQK